MTPKCNLDCHDSAQKPITEQNALQFKEVRLRALRESPSAFGSTYAKESQREDAEWVKVAARWSAEASAGFLAMDGEEGCGIAATAMDKKEDATCAHLYSMWTAPTHRQRGIGRLLVDAVIAWDVAHGARTLQLMVTSSNETAIRFYQRLGFALTGRTEAYPNDATLVEYEMVRVIS